MPTSIPGSPIGAPPAPPPMFRTLSIAASGLTAQRTRMETIASNIANADTTRTAEGGPYRRRVAEIGAATPAEFASELNGAQSAGEAHGVRVRAIHEDATEGPRVYQPGHPDADADGYVTYPNVRVTDEIVDLMDARRLFEANATVFQAAKSILRRSIDI